MSKGRSRIRIGTSGWSYNHWQGPYYPDDLAKNDWLAHYTHDFRTVEINNSFYQLPAIKTLQQWYAETPPGFVFCVKASRYITHMKKLRDPEKITSRFFNHISTLGDKLGPILFQLPPRWHLNEKRLSALFAELSREFRYTFEFRDHSWLTEQTYNLLRRHNAAFCIYDLAGYLTPKIITADFIYVRLHGPAGKYQGNYDGRVLSGWARTFTKWAAQHYKIYCYFDNDQAAFAVQNAMRLQAMLQGHGEPPQKD